MDTINKALIYDNQVQAIAVKSTILVSSAAKLHKLSPVCAAALGRTLTVTAMMASNLKSVNHSLSVSIKGGGKCGSIVTASDGGLDIRGYVDNPQVDLPLKPNGKLDVSGAVGNNGNITVIKDLGLKMPYVGQCKLVSGEIAEDFASYFAVSEQQPCALALGVLVNRDYTIKSAGGLLLNILPNCSEEVISNIENIASKLKDISTDMENITAKEYLAQLFNGCGIVFTEELYPRYRCKCNKEKIDSVIISIGKEEAIAAAEKDELKVICHFCNKEYKYNIKQTLALFK